MKRRLYAEGEQGAAILETPAGPLRVVGNYCYLGCRVDCTRTQNAELAARRSTAQATPTNSLGTFNSRRPGNPDEGQDDRGEVDRPQQASSPGRTVDVFEQCSEGTAAREVYGAFETHPWPAQAARARNPQDA